MRIGIDGYNLAMPYGTGVSTYGFALANAIQGLGHSVEGVFGIDVGKNPAIREVLFFDKLARVDKKRGSLTKLTFRLRQVRAAIGAVDAVEIPQTELVQREIFSGRLPKFDRIVSSPHLFDLAHKHFRLSGRFLKIHVERPPEIMHWTYPIPVEMVGTRNIYTLHDMVPLRLPYTTLDGKAQYYKLIKTCVERAAHICTVSNSSRNDILSRFNVRDEKVTNTYQSSPMPSDVLALDPVDDARMIDGIFGFAHRGYYLFFGAIEPKKNVGRMIEAYLSTHSDHVFVIVGARAWESEGELKLIANGGYGRMAKQVVRLDYLPRSLLLRLIRGARAVVFPSLYEGFGLPVLEAMQLGTPVITSDASSLPEVAGNAAKLVDPYSVASIAQAWREIDADEALRDTLSASGLRQAATFSEDQYRSRLKAMYDKVVANG